jgi:hypothetical protein
LLDVDCLINSSDFGLTSSAIVCFKRLIAIEIDSSFGACVNSSQVSCHASSFKSHASSSASKGALMAIDIPSSAIDMPSSKIREKLLFIINYEYKKLGADSNTIEILQPRTDCPYYQSRLMLLNHEGSVLLG